MFNNFLKEKHYIDVVNHCLKHPVYSLNKIIF